MRRIDAVRWLAHALCMAFVLSGGVAQAELSFDVCGSPERLSYIAAGARLHERTEIGAQGGELRLENPGTELQFDTGGRWLAGLAHRTTILAEQGIEFDTNGYLHSFYLVAHRLPDNGEGLRISLAPALSGSSNVTKDPDKWSADAFQANLALIWQSGENEQTSYRIGLCGDHRFGGYRVYPVLAIAWRFYRSWVAELGYPEASLEWQPAESVTLELGLSPDGNEWYVRNKALTRASDFTYESWSVELRGKWRATPHVELSVSAGLSFNQEVNAVLADGVHRDLRADSGARIGAGFRWSFWNDQ